MLHTPRAALFDLDGVIVDTEPQYTTFWDAIARRYLPQETNFAHTIKGQTLTYILNTYFPSASLQEDIVAALKQFEAEMHFPFIPGSVDYVNRLRAAGIPTAVVTSSNRKKMEGLYAKCPEIKQLFTAILTAEDAQRSKPAPDGYIVAAKRLGVEAQHCVIFEDSINGLLSARAAGGYVVALATSNAPALLAPLADRVIPDFIVLSAAPSFI